MSSHTHTAAAEAASNTGLRLYEDSVPEQKTAGLTEVTFTQHTDTSAISVKGQNVKTGKPSTVLAGKHFSKAFLYLISILSRSLCGELRYVFKSIAQHVTECFF